MPENIQPAAPLPAQAPPPLPSVGAATPAPTPVAPPTSAPAAPEARPQPQPSDPTPQPSKPANTESIYPTALEGRLAPDPDAGDPVAENLTGLTGSKHAQTKHRLPLGIYLIAGLILLGLASSFYNTSNGNNIIYSIGMLVDLLLAVGLLLRLEIARKLIIGFSAVVAIGAIIAVIGLVGLVPRMQKAVDNYDASISRQLRQSKLSALQKQKLRDQHDVLSDKAKQAKKMLTYAYIQQGATAAIMVATIYYLTRPHVKDAFNKR